MVKITIKVDVPFEWCEDCRLFELDDAIFESADGKIERTCANASICINAHDQRAMFYSSKSEGDKDK